MELCQRAECQSKADWTRRVSLYVCEEGHPAKGDRVALLPFYLCRPCGLELEDVELEGSIHTAGRASG